MLSALKRALGLVNEVEVVDDMIVGEVEMATLRRILREEPSLADPRTQARIQALFEDIEHERVKPPVLPRVALTLIEAAQSQEVNYDKLALQVVGDPAVASRLVKIASSAQYGAHAVRGVKDALVRIGHAGLWRFAVDLAFSTSTAKNGALLPLMERVIRHARAASGVARILAPLVGVHPDTAALAALAHGLGGIVLLDRLEAKGKDKPVPGFVVFVCIRRLHAAVAQQTAKQYGFPVAVVEALERHHGDLTDADDLTRLLSLADALTPGEPGARACPVDEAIARSCLPLTRERVLDRLRPLLASLEIATE